MIKSSFAALVFASAVHSDRFVNGVREHLCGQEPDSK
jgi:hypothetical protein